MTRFLKLTNTILIEPNKYHIHMISNKLFGHIGLCYGSGYGYVSSGNEQIEVCQTKHPNDYTTLKNSIRTADEFSSKLPVLDLYGAPRRGADSNLHWYKIVSEWIEKN